MTNKFIYNVLFCDDVRTERSGKDIAIGVYNGYIVVPQIPFVINLAVRLEINFHGKVINQVFARFSDPNGNVLIESSSAVEVADWSLPFSVTIPFIGLILPTAGNYKVFVKCEDDWEEERTLTVQKVNPEQLTEQFEHLAKHLRERLFPQQTEQKKEKID